MMRVLFALMTPALLLAQSATTNYRVDNINGRTVAIGSQEKGAGDTTERRKSVNGRLVPSEQTTEKVIREDANGKVVERTTKRYDDGGRLVQTERVIAEESPVRAGAKTVRESVSVSDVSGRFVETERRTTEIKTSGTTTTVDLSVDRTNPNGKFLPAERRSTVTSGAQQSQQIHETLQLPDLNGRFREAARTDATVQVTGDKTVSNASTYEPDAMGRMALKQQKVETTTKRAGGEVVETNIYSNQVAAQIRSGASGGPRIVEQQVLERKLGADGSVSESLSVRRVGSDPDRLGDARKISETVCTGKCLPDVPKAAEPAKPAAAPAKAATPTTTAAAAKGK